MIADSWIPTAYLRWSTFGVLQQKWQRLCTESTKAPIGWSTRQFIESEWRPIPSEEQQSSDPTSTESK